MSAAPRAQGNFVMTSGPLPTAIVLGVEAIGLAIARDLGRRGVTVIAVSDRSDAAGLGSRYIAQTLVSGDVLTQPDRVCADLVGACTGLDQKPIVFPTSDSGVDFLMAYSDRLADYATLAVPPQTAYDQIINKERLAAHASQAGIGSPRTCLVTKSSDLSSAVSDFRFPVVIKPRRAHEWRQNSIKSILGSSKGIRANKFDDFRYKTEVILEQLDSVIVQEWISGSDSNYFTLGVCISRTGELLAALTAQKVLQYPKNIGIGSIVVPHFDEEVFERGIALLRSLSYTGAAEVEFKRDDQSSPLQLIEINARLWDQHALGVACGQYFAWQLYADLASLDGDRPSLSAPPRPLKPSVWINESALAGSIKEALKNAHARSLALCFSTVMKKRVYAFWDSRDRRPFWRKFRGGGA